MSSSRLRICACTDTSSADTGSSQMMSFGSVTTARAIEMRWHWPPENSWGRRPPPAGSIPTASSTSSTLASRSLFAPISQMSRPSRTISRMRAARVERRDRVLEDHLEPGPHAPQRLAVQRREVDAVEADGPGDRRRELHHGPPGRRLAAPGLADEPERLAGRDVEADARDGVHPLAAVSDGELDDEVLDAQQRRVRVAEVDRARAGHQCPPAARRPRAMRPSRSFLARASLPSGVPTGNQQRNWCPAVGPARSGGSSSRQRSCT